MTTATQTPSAVTAPAAVPTLPAVDFETRLTMAEVGIDTLMAVVAGDALAEANAAASAAILEAQSTKDPTPVFQPHPVLERARRIIETRGWTQGAFESPTGSVCAMAAIREAAYGPGWYHKPTDDRERGPVEELMNRIAMDTGSMYSIPAWNDSRNGVHDVVRLLY